MRVLIVIFALAFSVVEVLFGGIAGPLLGLIGILATFAFIAHRRAGTIGYAIVVVLALLATLRSGGDYWLELAVYALLTVGARSEANRHARDEARAERMDRYVRQQLGE